MRILIAEDDQLFQSWMTELLPKWDYEPVVCNDGIEAWSLLQGEASPQLGLLDWLMPGMDGLEVCRKFRHTTATRSF